MATMTAHPHPYVGLHQHDQLSLYDSLVDTEEYVEFCAKDKQPKATITNHGNMFSLVPLAKACKEKGIQPIVGIEAYYVGGDHKHRPVKGEKSKVKTTHLTLLAETEEGWRNLSKLSTLSYTEGYYKRPRMGLDILRQYSKGIIAMSGCIGGAINKYFMAGDVKAATQQCEMLKAIFGPEHFFLEVQPEDSADQVKANNFIGKLAKQFKLKVVLTTDSHYMTPDDSMAHEVRVCISNEGQPLSDPTRYQYPKGSLRVRGTAEIFADPILKKFPKSAQRAWEIAERCNFYPAIGQIRMPKFPVPEGHTPDSWFDHKIAEGFRNVMPYIEEARKEKGIALQEYEDRIAYEKGVIKKTGFVEYFLVIADIIEQAKEAGIGVAPGRGSGCSSLVGYALGIHEVDPLYYDLMFERFLSEDRVAPPDIDIDIEHGR